MQPRQPYARMAATLALEHGGHIISWRKIRMCRITGRWLYGWQATVSDAQERYIGYVSLRPNLPSTTYNVEWMPRNAHSA